MGGLFDGSGGGQETPSWEVEVWEAGLVAFLSCIFFSQIN